MRRAIILFMLASSGGLLMACGGSNHAAATAHSKAATPTGTTASRSLTKPQALAFAHAVNLTSADVPGFSVSSTHGDETPREKQLEREMLHCVGTIGSGEGLAEVSSKPFEIKRGILDLGVSSEVGVARTSALAARELAAVRSAHVRACFSHFLDLIFKGRRFSGAIVSPVSIASGTPPAPGTAGSFGWRITATFAVQRVRVSLFVDILGFVYGPASVTLFSSGLLRPFPAAIQQRLFSLLLSRAEAHGL